MSLSPLHPALTIDLHVRIATGLHQGFPWLHPSQAKITIFRVLTATLSLRPFTVRIEAGGRCGQGGDPPSFPPCGTRPLAFTSPLGFATLGLAPMLDSLVRVSRRVGRQAGIASAPSTSKETSPPGPTKRTEAPASGSPRTPSQDEGSPRRSAHHGTSSAQKTLLRSPRGTHAPANGHATFPQGPLEPPKPTLAAFPPPTLHRDKPHAHPRNRTPQVPSPEGGGRKALEPRTGIDPTQLKPGTRQQSFGAVRFPHGSFKHF